MKLAFVVALIPGVISVRDNEVLIFEGKFRYRTHNPLNMDETPAEVQTILRHLT